MNFLQSIVLGFLLLLLFIGNTFGSGPCDISYGYKQVGIGKVMYYKNCSYCSSSFRKIERIFPADTNTFKPIEGKGKIKPTKGFNISYGAAEKQCQISYGKDKNSVYYEGRQIVGLDPDSFILDENFDIDDYELERSTFSNKLTSGENIFLVFFAFILILVGVRYTLTKRKSKKSIDNDIKKQL